MSIPLSNGNPPEKQSCVPGFRASGLPGFRASGLPLSELTNQYSTSSSTKDIVGYGYHHVVLHQRGSHGRNFPPRTVDVWQSAKEIADQLHKVLLISCMGRPAGAGKLSPKKRGNHEAETMEGGRKANHQERSPEIEIMELVDDEDKREKAIAIINRVYGKGLVKVFIKEFLGL